MMLTCDIILPRPQFLQDRQEKSKPYNKCSVRSVKWSHQRRKKKNNSVAVMVDETTDFGNTAQLSCPRVCDWKVTGECFTTCRVLYHADCGLYLIISIIRAYAHCYWVVRVALIVACSMWMWHYAHSVQGITWYMQWNVVWVQPTLT